MFRAAQFYGLLPVPGVYQPVVAAQDRFEETVVAVVVLGNEDRQFVLFDRNRRDLPARGFAGLAGDVGKREPEGRAAPFFRLHTDLSAEMFDNAFADRKPESRALFEGVEFDAFLTYNGSYCYDHEGTLYSNCIPSKDIERIIKNADKMGKPVALATKDRMAANGKDQDLIDYYAFGNAEVDVAEDFEDIKKEKVYQVLMGARVEEYQEILKGVQGAEITAWWDRAVDIIPVNAGKGAGIEKMLKYYGIDKSQAMAFGDGNNDIEMLKAVGNGIAMANASDDLKAVADEICGDVSEDGIYHYCLEKRLI